MSWKISRLSSTLMELLREPDPVPQAPEQIEAIRSRMLACLADCASNPGSERRVWARIMQADDIQALWFLRSDLMHLLCDTCGEARAAIKVSAVTELFRGLLPAAQFASSQRRL